MLTRGAIPLGKTDIDEKKKKRDDRYSKTKDDVCIRKPGIE